MGTIARGNTAEAAVLNAFVKRGFQVLVPFGGGQPYDLVVDLGSAGFLRVQCKAARSRDGCLIFNGRTTDHGRGRLSYLGRADVFGVWLDRDHPIYLIPINDADTCHPRLRFEPTRNNQRQGVRFAADYEVDRWTVEALRKLAASATASELTRRNGGPGGTHPTYCTCHHSEGIVAAHPYA